MYILAQVIGIISWIIFLISYHCKKLNRVIFMQIISSLLDFLRYALLGAWAGFFISIFELLKGLGYYKTDKDKYIFLFTIPIYILIGLVSNDGMLCIIPIVASLIDGYTIIISERVTVIGGIISNSLWIIYDLAFLDYAGVVSDLTLVFSNLSIIIYGYGKYLRRRDVSAFMGKYMSKNILSEVYKLDKEIYDKELLWSKEKMRELYNLERNSYILIKDKSKIIGYINILSVKKDLYDFIVKHSEDIYDTYNKEDIVPFKNVGNYYININSIVLKNEYQNKDSINKIVNEINKFIKIRRKKGFNIISMYSYSVNSFEKEVLEKMQFNKEKSITNEITLYTKNSLT